MRGIFHAAGPMVMETVLAGEGFRKALGLPARVMVKVEPGTSIVLVSIPGDDRKKGKLGGMQ